MLFVTCMMMNNPTITLITESIDGCYDNQVEELLEAGYLIDSEEQIFSSEDGTATVRYVLIKNDHTQFETRRFRDRSLNIPL